MSAALSLTGYPLDAVSQVPDDARASPRYDMAEGCTEAFTQAWTARPGLGRYEILRFHDTGTAGLNSLWDFAWRVTGRQLVACVRCGYGGAAGAFSLASFRRPVSEKETLPAFQRFFVPFEAAMVVECVGQP